MFHAISKHEPLATYGGSGFAIREGWFNFEQPKKAGRDGPRSLSAVWHHVFLQLSR